MTWPCVQGPYSRIQKASTDENATFSLNMENSQAGNCCCRVLDSLTDS